jgi:hypothetical protein
MRCLTIDECKNWRGESSRRRDWKKQVTCVTPLNRLAWFSNTLVEHLMPFQSALLVIDQVVFKVPPALAAIRLGAGETRSILEAPGHLFEDEPELFRAALEAALSDWIDLRVNLLPPRYALWADHDEYTTVFSQSPGQIADLKRALARAKIEIVDSYERENP